MAENIAKTFMGQASKTAHNYLSAAINDIDESLGKGYASNR